MGAATTLRLFSSPALRYLSVSEAAAAPVGLGAPLTKRNAGVSVLGCAIAMVAVCGCAQGIGQFFAALVVGMARSPSMKKDLFSLYDFPNPVTAEAPVDAEAWHMAWSQEEWEEALDSMYANGALTPV